jgi:hypothetical protein
MQMRRLPTLVFLAALLPSLAWIAPAGAQPSRPGANPSLAQAERNAVELKQGMTLEEVQKLLGKPKRTALRNTGSSAGEPWHFAVDLRLELGTHPAGGVRRQDAGTVVRE